MPLFPFSRKVLLELMSNSKNYNSIVFLTTLSVYLGLVLVGGTPSVYAQERTGKIDLTQDEVFRRVTEKCSKITPRIERLFYPNPPLLNSIDEYVNALVDLTAHSECTSPDGFAFIGKIYFSDGTYLSKNSVQQKPSSKGSWVSGVLSSHIFTISNSLPHGSKSGELYFEIDFELNKSELLCSAKFTQDSADIAHQTAVLYQNSLQQWQSAKRNTKEKALYENTYISSENNQIFIVTRLPRASIDEFLADKTDAQ